ncbi:GGDEF domain-containing protein (plasmid) [Butyrivibrio proteoclasticus B316]|uniref:GGDEF domain-containing protein n=1 Tax=Butyrivibrio proteoclasticus (strain ATCC 51982 / DSM 14932 / B316) TaxID=515622 RepID=E0S4E8_BUTPB|nr:GGDEF domain-containing protein [Butyrivibrio proteoclasticus]ADL36280.1 GGDEF domain-containing protein [Butyrivibrio proteoclasticus B316]
MEINYTKLSKAYLHIVRWYCALGIGFSILAFCDALITKLLCVPEIFRYSNLLLPGICVILLILCMIRTTTKEPGAGAKEFEKLFNAFIFVWALPIMFLWNFPGIQLLAVAGLFIAVLLDDKRSLLFFLLTGALCANGVLAFLTASLIPFATDIIAVMVMIFSYGLLRNIARYQNKLKLSGKEAKERSNFYKQELHFDNLTGVYSRGWLMSNGSEKMKHIAGVRRLAVAMIDIDHFKSVNDTYGHDGGDEVLKRLGKILKTVQSANTIVGRYGGEEFTLIFDNQENEKEILEGLLSEFRKQSFDFTDEHFTFSGGLYIVNSPMTLDEALKKADENLYYSKEHGRNQITESC